MKVIIANALPKQNFMNGFSLLSRARQDTGHKSSGILTIL